MPRKWPGMFSPAHLAQQAADAAVEEVAAHMRIHSRQRVIQQVHICARGKAGRSRTTATSAGLRSVSRCQQASTAIASGVSSSTGACHAAQSAAPASA